MGHRIARLLPPLLVIATITLAYADLAAGAGYVHDDHPAVTDNPFVTWPPPVAEIFSGRYFGPASKFGDFPSRPLVTLLFAAEIPLGLDSAPARHLLQLGLYAAVCLLVLRLVRQVLAGTGLSDLQSRVGGTVAAVVFAVHPVHVEAVMALAYRPELLALLLTLPATSLLLQVRLGAPWRLRTLAVAGLLAAALLCKESAIGAFGVWLAWALSSRIAWQRLALPVASLLPVVAAWAAWRRWNIGSMLAAAVPPHDNPLAHVAPGPRLLTGLDLAGRVLERLVLPHDLAPDYTFDAWPVRTTLTAVGFVGLTFLLGVVLATVKLALGLRTGRIPTSSDRLAPQEAGLLALLWLLAFYLPISQLPFPSTVLFADRLLFAPSLPVVALAAVPLALWAGTWREQRGRAVAAALTVPVVMAHAIVELRSTARDWQDDRRLYARGVRLQPRSFRMRYDLAQRLARDGDHAAALPHLLAAEKLDPDAPQLLTLGIEVHTKAGDCDGARRLVDRLAQRPAHQGKARLAAADWGLRCKQPAVAWPISRQVAPRHVVGPWPARLYALAVAAGDEAGAQAWAQRYSPAPQQDPRMVAAAVHGEEVAGRPDRALQRLIDLQKARPELGGLDKAAWDLYERHRQGPAAADLRARLRQAWPSTDR